MAAKKGNITALIREILEESPEASGNDVIEKLSASVKFKEDGDQSGPSRQYIRNQVSKIRKALGKPKKKRGPKPAAPPEDIDILADDAPLVPSKANGHVENPMFRLDALKTAEKHLEMAIMKAEVAGDGALAEVLADTRREISVKVLAAKRGSA